MKKNLFNKIFKKKKVEPAKEWTIESCKEWYHKMIHGTPGVISYVSINKCHDCYKLIGDPDMYLINNVYESMSKLEQIENAEEEIRLLKEDGEIEEAERLELILKEYKDKPE